ncbi:MAG: aldo/keto reductase [Prevotellaceae bacterium]|nr:aldo/keto reductase [Candidatus Minthosoma caballi]
MITLNNGTQIPHIGVGTWTLRDEIAVNNVKFALQAGFRLIDTAQMYENESEVGEGIKQSGVKREDIFVTTKVSTTVMRGSEETIRQAIDESIRKLGNYIDLLLIHWPVKNCVMKTWKIMEEYVKSGKVKSLGISNFHPHHIEELLEYAEIKPVLNQLEVHPLMSQVENIAYNKSQGIQVQAWGPFGQGDINIPGIETIQTIAKKYGKTPSQIVLRWIVQRDLITIPRAKPKHFEENLQIMQFELSSEDMIAIDALNQNMRSSVDNDPENFPW